MSTPRAFQKQNRNSDIRRRQTQPVYRYQPAAIVNIAKPSQKLIAPAFIKSSGTVDTSSNTSSLFFGRVKNTSRIFGIVVATFGLTLASSLAMAHIEEPNQPANQNPPIVVVSSANDLYAQTTDLTVTSIPDSPLFNPTVITDPNAIYLPIEKEDVPDPLSQRKAFLEAYLKSKNSPLADHVDALSEQTQWKLIIAIADAESSYCKRKELNDCWGIGGAWDLKAYSNYDQAIADVNRILEQHYIAAGLDSPDQIEYKWVGHPNDNWEAAADQVMDDLKNVQ
jgi:hypothetical protein